MTATSKRTLQGHCHSHPVCAATPLTFPVDLRSDGDAARKQQLEPLVAAGLIAVTTIQKDEPAAPGQGQATNYHRYAPNAAGEKVVRKGADSFLGGTDIWPADAAGAKVSRVTYGYELKDVEPWATGRDIASTFPQIETLLAKPTTRRPAFWFRPTMAGSTNATYADEESIEIEAELPNSCYTAMGRRRFSRCGTMPVPSPDDCPDFSTISG
jgi:hypothetical protein